MVEIIGHCGEGYFLRHIHGIGSIGKTSLLQHWNRLFDYAIYIDCAESNDLISRIGRIGQGVQRLGIDAPRFRLPSPPPQSTGRPHLAAGSPQILMSFQSLLKFPTYGTTEGKIALNCNLGQR